MAGKERYWIVPSDLWQQILAGATTPPADQTFEGAIIASVSKPTPGSLGPYADKAAAAAAMAKLQKKDSAGVHVNVPVISEAAALAGGVTEIGHWFGVVATALTDVHMWISLGWLLLGLVLLILGFWSLLRKADVLPAAAPVPVPV